MSSIIAGSVLVGLLVVGMDGQSPTLLNTPLPLTASCPVTHPVAAPVASNQFHRLVWENREQLCRYVDKGEDGWVELDKDGQVFLQFKELKRNCDFVELSDQKRGYILRLYSDALFIKGGHEGFHKFDEFTQFYSGVWVK